MSTPTEDRAPETAATAPPRGELASPSPGPGHATAFPSNSPRRGRKVFSTVLKLVVATAVCALLWRSGAIDREKLGRVATALSNPVWLARSGGTVFACITIITIRWWLLLRLEEIPLSLVDALKLTLVGHFWNNVLPGAVTGDVVKMYYIGRKHPEKKAETYATVMIDRVIGLAALVYLSFFAALANLDFIWAPGREKLVYTFYAIALAAGGFTAGILALVLGVGRKSSLADRVRASKLPFLEGARRGYRTLTRLGEPRGRATLVASVSLGVVSHFLLVVIAMSAGREIGEGHLDPKSYAFLVPCGLFVNSLPFGLPGGIGVGEAAFDQLFIWGGGVDARGSSYGLSVMVLSRVVQLGWALVGGVLYVFDHRALSPGAAPPPTQTVAD